VHPEINALQSSMRKRSGGFIATAEKRRHSEDVCSYVKCDIGMAARGEHRPDGREDARAGPPALSYTGCFTFMKWFELLRERVRCPVAMLHVPYQPDGKITADMVEYVKKQLETEVIPRFEEVTGKTLRHRPPARVARASPRAEDDLVWVLESAKNRPSPIDAYFGGVYYIGPMFTAFRGTEAALDYYRSLRREVEDRAWPTGKGR
jgi:benzoyl-CoA reductase subunit B